MTAASAASCSSRPTSSRLPRFGRSTPPSPPRIPGFAPFICIDQEGGAIQRLTKAKGFVGLPGAARIARMGLDKAYELDTRAAQELAGLGFNVNLGRSST